MLLAVSEALADGQVSRFDYDCIPRIGTGLAGGVGLQGEVCGALMGFNVDELLHVKLAGEEGLGVADLDKIEVRGTPIAELARRVVRYGEAAKERFGAVTIIEKDMCTGCMGEMESAFLYINKAGFGYRLEDLTLVLGMVDELPPVETMIAVAF